MRLILPKNQDGVTLLISVLVMSGLAMISLAVGAFTIQEIRSSRATALTEPAIAAAESGGEKAIWDIKREIATGVDDCPTIDASDLGNNTRTEFCRTYGPAILVMPPSTDIELHVYDPENINGNLCMNATYTEGQYAGCSGAALVTSITIRKVSGNGPVQYEVEDLSGRPIASGSTQTPVTIPIPDPIPSSSDERIVIRISSTGGETVEVNALPLGMPDRPVIRSNGCSSRGLISGSCDGTEVFNRRIDVTVQ